MESALRNTESSYNKQSFTAIEAKLMRNELIRLLCFAIIPVIVFGGLTFAILGRNLYMDTTAKDMAHMEYVQTQMDFIVKELDALNLTFCVNADITRSFARAFTLNDTQAMTALKRICYNYMIPTVAAHDYIHSLYFYTDNEQGIFLSSAVGPALLSGYGDQGWFDTYQAMRKSNATFAAQCRAFKEYRFEQEPRRVITLYRSLYLRSGVIVLNLRQEYFDEMLASQRSSNNQILLVTNESHEILMCSIADFTPIQEEIERLYKAPDEELRNLSIGGESYFVTRLSSGNRYNWSYLSLTPAREVFAFSNGLFGILALILVPTVLICAFFAWKHSKIYSRNAMRILQTLEAVERHEELAAPKQVGEDFYGMVTQRILQNYAERNNLRYLLEQKQHTLREMELSALHSQVNPHFLFNTLKSIYWMSVSLFRGPNDVSRMIENMTEILEYSLDTSEDLSSIGDEIRNTKAYIEIQHMRYKDRFEVAWEYDPELEACYTGKLLLQPLIENAIMHGMSWDKRRKLHITVRMERQDDWIELSVRDDGVGIAPEALKKLLSRLDAHSNEGHIGLYSCNKRLCLTFGEECGLRIQSEEGTVISMRFPCLTLDAAGGGTG